MLISFKLRNYKSFREEVELNLLAHAADKTFPGALIEASAAERSLTLLPALAIYGPNASGKTNLLMAMNYMRGAVAYSQSIWKPGAGTEVHCNASNPDQSTLLEANILVAGIRFRYGFEVSSGYFHKEWLYSYPKGRERLLFVRETIFVNDQYVTSAELGKSLSGEKRTHLSSLSRVRENSLFMSSLAQDNQDDVMSIFHSIARWNISIGNSRDEFNTDLSGWMLTRMPHLKTLVMSLVQLADPAIKDLIVTEEDQPGRPGTSKKSYNTEFKLTVNDEEHVISHQFQSRGIKKLYALCSELVWGLFTGQVVIVDELETSLHPHISAKLVSLFQDSSTNPNGAQLIFSTHESRLLSLRHLRRDQVWFVEKSNGLSDLYSLLEFSPRKDENLEQGYLSGRYGGVPLGGLDPAWYNAIKQFDGENLPDE